MPYRLIFRWFILVNQVQFTLADYGCQEKSEKVRWVNPGDSVLILSFARCTFLQKIENKDYIFAFL